jgi:hypothetical protein
MFFSILARSLTNSPGLDAVIETFLSYCVYIYSSPSVGKATVCMRSLKELHSTNCLTGQTVAPFAAYAYVCNTSNIRSCRSPCSLDSTAAVETYGGGRAGAIAIEASKERRRQRRRRTEEGGAALR